MSYSDRLDFGKHYGLTLSQVMFRDPDWIFWAHESGVLAKHGYGLRAAEILRARQAHPDSECGLGALGR